MIEVTERDKKIFNVLFRLRYMTPKQLGLYIGCSIKSIYDRAEKLTNDRYLESTRIKHINKRVYSNGWLVRKDQERFTYRKKVIVNDDTTEKYLLLNDIFIHLANGLGIDEDAITTEREMFWKRTGLKSENKTIIPSLVVRKGKNIIAIKLEKSLKKQDDLRNVFKNYTFYTDFYCVNYLCTTKKIKNRIEKVIKKDGRTFIKAYLIEEFFTGENFDLC